MLHNLGVGLLPWLWPVASCLPPAVAQQTLQVARNVWAEGPKKYCHEKKSWLATFTPKLPDGTFKLTNVTN